MNVYLDNKGHTKDLNTAYRDLPNYSKKINEDMQLYLLGYNIIVVGIMHQSSVFSYNHKIQSMLLQRYVPCTLCLSLISNSIVSIQLLVFLVSALLGTSSLLCSFIKGVHTVQVLILN